MVNTSSVFLILLAGLVSGRCPNGGQLDWVNGNANLLFLLDNSLEPSIWQRSLKFVVSVAEALGEAAEFPELRVGVIAFGENSQTMWPGEHEPPVFSLGVIPDEEELVAALSSGSLGSHRNVHEAMRDANFLLTNNPEATRERSNIVVLVTGGPSSAPDLTKMHAEGLGHVDNLRMLAVGILDALESSDNRTATEDELQGLVSSPDHVYLLQGEEALTHVAEDLIQATCKFSNFEQEEQDEPEIRHRVGRRLGGGYDTGVVVASFFASAAAGFVVGCVGVIVVYYAYRYFKRRRRTSVKMIDPLEDAGLISLIPTGGKMDEGAKGNGTELDAAYQARDIAMIEELLLGGQDSYDLLASSFPETVRGIEELFEKLSSSKAGAAEKEPLSSPPNAIP